MLLSFINLQSSHLFYVFLSYQIDKDMAYYIAAIVLFLLVGYIIHKLAYKRFKKLNGRTPNRRELWSIYHWEGVLGLSALTVLVIVYILKASNVLPI